MLIGSMRINARGNLEIGGCDTVDLVKEFGIPHYVMDADRIHQRCVAYN